MNMNRRHLAGSAIAVGLALAGSAASAAASDEADVLKLTRAHRDALFAADAKALEKLCAPELSYSHSDAHVEDRATFVANATNGKSKWLSLAYEDVKVRVVGDTAIVRFHFVGENQSGDKKSQPNLAILMIWQKQAAQWALLARASTKL
jgi:ketosteroid isomerase-like protein